MDIKTGPLRMKCSAEPRFGEVGEVAERGSAVQNRKEISG